jgi:CHAT domain-containing protein
VAYVVYDRLSPARAQTFPPTVEEARGLIPRARPTDRVGLGRSVPSYLAFVVRSGEEIPTVVPLGDRRTVDRLLADWREQVGSPPRGLRGSGAQRNKEYRRSGHRLREAIWDPVARHVGSVDRVLIVPDGALHLVNLAALPSGRERYLLEDGPVLHYLSSERELVPPREKRVAASGLIAIGGPDFDAAPRQSERSLLAQAKLDTPAATALASSGATYRSSPPSCRAFLGESFPPLLGARAEAVAIAKLWRENLAPARGEEAAVLTLTDGAASELAFKRLAPGRRVIHVATHGYFLQDECTSVITATREAAASGDPDYAPATLGDNPLLLSGIALAGANRRKGREEGDEDGILTAEEIASLDLGDTDWVVLSGCETGLGKLQAGEGVLGLRRALQIAGARTLIMSLWRVEEEATREWMARLYRARLSGLSTIEAVRRASLEALEARREAGESTHPFFWGAFIASGDWR